MLQFLQAVLADPGIAQSPKTGVDTVPRHVFAMQSLFEKSTIGTNLLHSVMGHLQGGFTQGQCVPVFFGEVVGQGDNRRAWLHGSWGFSVIF